MKNRYARPSDLLYHTYRFFKRRLNKTVVTKYEVFSIISSVQSMSGN